MSHNSEDSFQAIDSLYSENTRGIEAIIAAIARQNAIIHSLQHRHRQLKAQENRQSQVSQDESKQVQSSKEALRQQQEQESTREKHIFLEEALSAKQKVYEEEFAVKKTQLLEEIYLKYQQICGARKEKGGRTNLFMHIRMETQQ